MKTHVHLIWEEAFALGHGPCLVVHGGPWPMPRGSWASKHKKMRKTKTRKAYSIESNSGGALIPP